MQKMSGGSFWDEIKTLYLERDKDLIDFDQECPILMQITEQIEREISKNDYEIIKPIGRGGSGIIVLTRHKTLNLYRALKIPRPKEDTIIDSLKNEIEHLKGIRHDNIINIYDFGFVTMKGTTYPYFIMDHIDGARDLKDALEDFIRKSSRNEIARITSWLAERLYITARAIAFLHNRDIIHFDVKPGNVLLDPNDKPILSDLGFAKKKTPSPEPVEIGFTLLYGHPTLKEEYHHLTSKNHVKHKLAPKDFSFSFDIYAFGRSINELLGAIDLGYPDLVAYDYGFAYLHLMACRMLDGRNLSNRDIARIQDKQRAESGEVSVYKETWFRLEESGFDTIKYTNIDNIVQDFEKFLHPNDFLETIPELGHYYPKRIQSGWDIPTTFSQRIKYIVEHPIFARLFDVPQLGLLRYVYPSATHTRLEHSIGTLGNCCQYIQALFNDPYNPLFKQIFDVNDVKCVMLAGLLHDLGHYPLAHDLEEFNPRLKHEIFTLMLLDSPVLDRHSHTLKEIVENSEWGWGVNIEYLKSVFGRESTPGSLFDQNVLNIRQDIINSIIDGPLDADKLDYLVRDSENCYLRYGLLIDVDRLTRNLTIAIYQSEDRKQHVTIGTYERGQSAAEAMTFSRYLLYQALYWHHTARSVRIMLREILALTNSSTGKRKGKDFEKLLQDNIGIQGKYGILTIKDVLDMLRECTDETGSELLDLIEQREYYKRILTIHEETVEEGKESLLQRFRANHRKPGFQSALQKELCKKFMNIISHTGTSQSVALTSDRKNEVLAELEKPKRVLTDCPEPRAGAAKELRFSPEPQRLQRNYLLMYDTVERVSAVWNKVHFKLMSIAAKGRIYCHPAIRDTLMTALGPSGINDCVKDVVSKYSQS